MRGRKPKLDNVVRLPGQASPARAVDRVIRRLQPRGLSKELRAEHKARQDAHANRDDF